MTDGEEALDCDSILESLMLDRCNSTAWSAYENASTPTRNCCQFQALRLDLKNSLIAVGSTLVDGERVYRTERTQRD